jgi:CheY-like chemotaxis protein
LPKIAILEDDVTMLSLLETLLQLEGYRVVMIKDQKQDHILETLEQEQPDLALIDVNMREINGFDLLSQMKQDKSLENVRILMSSGMNFSSECKEKGADGFILKPYMPDDLIQLLKRMLAA